MKRIIIAIDGYSSCGKSTLAKQLAAKLGYTYIDSGAMYRAVTLYFLNHKIDWTNSDYVVEALKHIHIEFGNTDKITSNEIFLNGKHVENEIRTMKISEHVSPISAIPSVRDSLMAQQKRMGEKRGIVMDGRDIGTAIFPDAELKIFMTASKEIRAQRRWLELKNKGVILSLGEVLDNLEKRDYQDTYRLYHPLKKAPDAMVLDNSNLSEEEQLDIVLQAANKIIQ